jgi:hypothetical protein
VWEAVEKETHPFRYVTLATIDKENMPRQRTVVLRDFTENPEPIFTIYTDSRSDKISQIMENDKVSLLFYDDKTKLQLRATGTASIIKAGEEYKRNWDNRGSKSPHSYTSVNAPGTEIKNPEEAYEWRLEGTPNFCLIKIEAERMEFLQLDGVRHVRSESIIRNEEKLKRWLAP